MSVYDSMPTPPPGFCLSISEIERLAKAGVTVNLHGPCIPQSDPYVHQEQKFQSRVYPMIDAFWERWRRANTAAREDGFETFGMYAIEVGDKVQALFHEGSRFVVIEDEKILYPSDALMAKVHLWRQTK